MKIQLHVLLFVFCLAATMRPASAGVLPAYLVPFASGPIRADGKLDEPAWSQAAWTRDFVWIDAGDTAPLRSRAKMLYDREGLHFAFEFVSIKQSTPPPLDPDLPTACEIFLDVEGRGREYLEYAVAPDGTEHSMIWQGRLSMRQWKAAPGIESRRGVTRIALNADRDLMTYEVSFPWRGMGSLAHGSTLPPTRGTAWRANFSRVESPQIVGDYAGDYVWSPAGVYYMHQPNTFGWLVFAGEPNQNPLHKIDPQHLVTLPDVSSTLGTKAMPAFSRIYWTRFPLLAARDGYYAVTKTSVTLLNRNGEAMWERTRADGLPQFIRSCGVASGVLRLSGNGIGEGLVSVDEQGRVQRITVPRNPGAVALPEVTPLVLSLKFDRCLLVWSDGFQIIRHNAGALIKTEDKVLCAAALTPNRFAIGTTQGFELYDESGKLLQRAAIAGGITAMTSWRGAALGASGKNGLFRMTESGCEYFPSPLRTKFDKVFTDEKGRCWASYIGGIALIENGQVQFFDAPLGLEGLRIVDGAASGETMIFAATIPGANWYASGRYSSLLLIYDNGQWHKISFEDGLPAQVNALSTYSDQVFVSTNAGVFQWKGRK